MSRNVVNRSLLEWAWPLLFGVLVLVPLGLFFLDLARDPAGLARTLIGDGAEARRLAGLWLKSMGIAAGAALFSLLLALPIFITHENLRHHWLKRILLGLAFLPLLTPGHVLSIAWIQAIGQAGWLTHSLASGSAASHRLPKLLYSSLGCAIVMAARYFPVMLALALIGRRGWSRGLLEAGSVNAHPTRLWLAALGSLRPWLWAGGLLVFLLCLLDYGMPSLLRQNVFTLEIMNAFQINWDTRLAQGLTLPLLLAALPGALLFGRQLRRLHWPAASCASATLPRLPALCLLPLSVGGWMMALIAGLLPLVTLLGWAGGWSSYASILASAGDEMRTSLACSLAAAAVAVIFAAGLAMHGIWRGPRQGNPRTSMLSMHNFLMWIMLLLFALPGAALGIALIRCWNQPGLGGLLQRFYDSGAMLPLGLVILHLPLVYLALRVALSELPRVLLEQQMITPARAWHRWRLLLGARLGGVAWGVGLLAFILMMQETQTSVLLAAPGQETMAIRSLTLLHYAPDRLVAAYCLFLIALLAAPPLLASLFARAWHHWQEWRNPAGSPSKEG